MSFLQYFFGLRLPPDPKSISNVSTNRSAVKSKHRFKLNKSDVNFVAEYMSMFPRESDYPLYDSSYQDAFSKFILWVKKKDRHNRDIHIFHKSGEAYGFLTDVCYVVDFDNKIEFMLCATIHCNLDGT